MIKSETITSISTAPGVGAIGIIRISGVKAFKIASQIYIPKNILFEEIKSHTITYGKIIDPQSKELVDEVLLSKMKGPKTYTTEDIIEINCHGGIVVIKKILQICCKMGARIAEPGEFTKRAFLNGRIDLSQAEAVIDIINSKASESLKASVEQLEGKLSRNIKNVRQNIISVLAHIEAMIDYPEYDIEEITNSKIFTMLKDVQNRLKLIGDGFEKGRIIRDGLKIVIAGKPNVGKSSLLNFIVGRDRSIVTEIAGTTRDAIEEYVDFSGIPVSLVDTAGIRETQDIVENIGVSKAKQYIQNSDFVIFMVDAISGLDNDDIRAFDEIKQKNHIVLINKIDNSSTEKISIIREFFKEHFIIEASVSKEKGIDDLEKYIREAFALGDITTNSEVLLTNIRHKSLIDNAQISIEEALSGLLMNIPPDILTIDLKNCCEYLGMITGESVDEDVIKEIFSRFCLGK